MFSINASKVIRRAAVAGVVALAVVAACGEDGGTDPEGNDVELQIIGGLANSPNEGNFVHVLTPRTNAFDAMPHGDQTNSDNWTYLDMDLRQGEEITISVLTGAGDTLMTDKCIVDLTEAGGDESYARTVVFWFASPNNYADCADNLVDPAD